MNLSSLAIQKFFDNAGIPLNGGKLFTYTAGTTTKLATYQDQAGTLNANPVPLNFRGEANIWLDPTLTYKYVLAPSTDTDPPTNPIWTVDNISVGITFASLTQQILGLIIYPRTQEEINATVVPTFNIYPELDIRRYGALTTNTGAQNATAIQKAISVLAQHSDGEMLIPEGQSYSVSQVTFASMTAFNIRCDGVLVSSASQPGTPFTDARGASAGLFAPMKFTSCTNWKLYGKGYIQNGFVEPLYITSCTDFSISLDLRGNGTNSTLSGVALRFCGQFVFHDMTVDSITAQAMKAALTTTGALLIGATTATATTWTAGAGTFNVRFSNGDLRLVTFGAGTTNVSMAWAGGLSSAATATYYAEIYYTWLNNFQIWDCSGYTIEKVISRRAGMNGINPSSNCTDFAIQNCTCEYNAGSGIQLSWAAFGVFPSRFSITSNLLRFNQADGLDVANTSGVSPTSIYAVIDGNLHVQNGWINCDPANPAGADGSGVGTFIAVADFSVVGNMVYESANSAIYVQDCSVFSIVSNEVQKLGAGNVGFGLHLNNCTSADIDSNIIKFTNGEALGLVNTISGVSIRGNVFQGKVDASLLLVATGSSFVDNKVTTANSITALMPFRGGFITCTGAVTAVVLGGDFISLDGVTIVATTAGGSAVTATNRSGCSIKHCVIQANSRALQISGGASNTVTSNYLESAALPTLEVTGAADRTFVQGNRINNTAAAFSINVVAGVTRTSVVGNTIIAGPTNYGGTYEINFP